MTKGDRRCGTIGAKHVGAMALTLATLTTAGCAAVANEDTQRDSPYTVKSVEDARQETRELSSMLLDLTEIQGQVSEPGPGIDLCEEDPDRERLYTVYHAWSVRGVSAETLETGMAQLRDELINRGWEVVEDGELNNADRTPRVLLENPDIEYAVNVELPGRTRGEPRLSVNLASACFSTPEGESPRGEF
ncbi:hypothetical protein [Streptomyces sp. NPDC127098]|uniref:hypothetical protein n=1 Tax=Streptomyces sp. NPDC127098 TaxID=3347137 RepID=UPI00365502EF